MLANCYFNLSEVLQASGDLQAALEAVQQAKAIWPVSQSNWEERMDAWEAQLHLGQGDFSIAARWADENMQLLEQEPDQQNYQLFYALAVILAEGGKTEPAYETANALAKRLEEYGVSRSLVQVLVFQALTLDSWGEHDLAEAALEIAQPESYIRVFMDAGVPAHSLLKSSQSRWKTGLALKEYTEKLLEHFEQELSGELQLAKSQPEVLIEALSPREMEVLQWLDSP